MADTPERPRKPGPPKPGSQQPAPPQPTPGKLPSSGGTPPAGKLPTGKAVPRDSSDAVPAPDKATVRAVNKPPLAKVRRATPETVPVGKLVTPASVAPPPSTPPGVDRIAFSAGTAGQSGAFRARRRGTPPVVWAMFGLGVVAVGVLGAFLIMKSQDKDETEAKSDAKDHKAAHKNDDAKKDAKDDDSKNKPDATDEKKGAKSPDDKPKATPAEDSNKKPAGEERGKPNEAPKPVPETPVQAPPKVAVKQFRGIEEVPTGERPAALDNFINDCVAQLEAGKFEEFFQANVDPRDRGAAPPAIGTRRRNDSPYDVLAQGTERIGRILAGIGTRTPYLFEDGKIVVFDLSPRTRPTFVEHEGRWYLSRGKFTQMDQRFTAMSDQDEIVYLLETTSGKPAVAAADGGRDGAEQGVIDQLIGMGATVALSHPDEEYRRSAVMLTDKFKGGDAGLALLGQLNDRSQLVVLYIDGMSGSNITEEIGLMELDQLAYVEYLRFTNVPVQRHPVTVHFQEMSKLKTLILDGGSLVGDSQIADHLRTCAELKRVTFKGDQISDSMLERFKKFTVLESLELEGPSNAVSAGGVADLRQSVPGLWVDY
jgi:hypothetical protein